MSLFILLLASVSFAAAIASVLAASTGRRWEPHPAAAEPHARQILDERLARGEIDVEDYLDRRAALRGDWANGMEYHPSEPVDNPPHEPPLVAQPSPRTPPRRILDDRPLIHVMPGLVEPPLPPHLN